MKSVIVGTAGHIDHGKTALVKALTGIDADRLAEEKRRGITIDLGFAHLELPESGAPGPAGNSPGGGIRLGFVDVPGHERFVRNMLAGVGGIDLVLLVIAADESIKPQTREHFDICRMLNIPRGLTVLTKTDLVDSDTLEVVRLEVEDFLRGSFLEGAPILAASSLTGQGLDGLRRELAAMARAVPDRNAHAVFRLPIDRVFSMKGFGTVVTGTLISGGVRKEEEIEVFPTGKRLRVRGIQVHGAAAEEARAGQRTALNLAAATTEELARGMTLAPPGVFSVTTRADAQIRLLPGARPLRDRSRVHFHCYTAEVIAEVVLLSSRRPAAQSEAAESPLQLAPGGTAWAQLRFREPLLLLPGDRFILRQFSPVVTVGGGVVVDAAPLPLRISRHDELEMRLAQLTRLAEGSRAEQWMTRIARRGERGLSLAEALAETGWTRQDLAELLPSIRAPLEQVKLPANWQRSVPKTPPVPGKAAKTAAAPDFFAGVQPGAVRLGDILVENTNFLSSQIRMWLTVAAFHKANPLVAGIGKEELREKLDLPAEVFTGALEALVRDKRLQVSAEQVSEAGRGVVMKDDEADSKRRIEAAFAGAGLKVPALKEVLAGLTVDRSRAQQIVTLLLRDRTLIKVTDDLVFHRSALEQLRQLVAEYKKSSPKIDVGKFKDLAGITRKYAIPLLEYLDRERVTRRQGDERIIL